MVGQALDYAGRRVELHDRLHEICERRRAESMELSSLITALLRTSSVGDGLRARHTVR
jgi:hypothetical protein